MKYVVTWLMMLSITLTGMAQDLETFTSEFYGNLIIEYPSDWMAYDSQLEQVVVVARGEVSVSQDLESGQAALLLLTPQGLEASGLPTNDLDVAVQALIREMPDDVVITDFISEYGNGTSYQFNLNNTMQFRVVTFDREGVPLIAILGANNAPAQDVIALENVITTVRYTDNIFQSNAVILSTSITDPTYGYTYDVPASWQAIDNFSYSILGTSDYGTILLLDRESLQNDDMLINFDTIIQSERALVAGQLAQQTEVSTNRVSPINGYETAEVVMTLTEGDEEIAPFEYRFLLVDYGNNNMLLSAIYSEAFGTTQNYVPTLRAIAETFYYAPIFPLSNEVEIAGATVPYPDNYELNTLDAYYFIITQDDVQITIHSQDQTVTDYGEIASGQTQALIESIAITNDVSFDNINLIRIASDLEVYQLIVEMDDQLKIYASRDSQAGSPLWVAELPKEQLESVEQVIYAMMAQTDEVIVPQG